MAHEIRDPLLIKIAESVRKELDGEFDFLSPGPIPWSPPPASLASVPVALVTTAALHMKGDRPFTTHESPFGDTSYRWIPHGTPAHGLDLAAPYVDRRHIPHDPEVALPRRALDALHRRGIVGPPAPRHASFSAGIVRPHPGLEESAASLFEGLQQDGVGAVVLFPTCPLCVQTICLLARDLECRGMPTVAVSLLPELSRIVGAPRVITLRFPFGAPCGDPGHTTLHQAVLREALALLVEAAEAGATRESRLAWRREPPE